MSEGFFKVFAISFLRRRCAQRFAQHFERRTRRTSVRAFSYSLHNERGQTMVEYLLLLVATFLTAYVMITGPVADFTLQMVEQVRQVTTNIVRSGEMRPRTLEPGQSGHPSDPVRFKAEHL